MNNIARNSNNLIIISITIIVLSGILIYFAESLSNKNLYFLFPLLVIPAFFYRKRKLLIDFSNGKISVNIKKAAKKENSFFREKKDICEVYLYKYSDKRRSQGSDTYATRERIVLYCLSLVTKQNEEIYIDEHCESDWKVNREKITGLAESLSSYFSCELKMEIEDEQKNDEGMIEKYGDIKTTMMANNPQEYETDIMFKKRVLKKI